MPPVAKRWKEYEEGSPQRELQDAVAARFDPAERFFEKVAEALTIRQDSASGTFYGFLAGSRSLPASHRAVYLRELETSGEVLDAIEAERAVTTSEGLSRLARLEAAVAEVARVQALLLDELALHVDDEGRLASRGAPPRGRRTPGAR